MSEYERQNPLLDFEMTLILFLSSYNKLKAKPIFELKMQIRFVLTSYDISQLSDNAA